jgi:hypothetical protein
MGSNQNTLQSYTLTLLTLVGSQPGADDDPPFGFAFRLVKTTTIFHQTAHRILQALIQYSPSPETVADQFLTELAKCENTDIVTLSDAFSTLFDLFYVKYYAKSTICPEIVPSTQISGPQTCIQN